jgi:hypothetical protein
MKAIYTEGGERYEVEVLADNSDYEAWRYRLTRIDTGEEFNFMKRKDGAGWAGIGVLRFPDGRVVPDNVISYKMQ